jgi:hypothetical protein
MRLSFATFVVLVVGIWPAAALGDPPGLITRPDDRAGIRGADAPASTMQVPAVRPDDRAGIRGVGSDLATQSAAVRPDDRAGIRGVGALEIATSRLSASGGSGFDWVDAGVGAGSTLGLMFLGGGIFLASRRRGSTPTPALHG